MTLKRKESQTESEPESESIFNRFFVMFITAGLVIQFQHYYYYVNLLFEVKNVIVGSINQPKTFYRNQVTGPNYVFTIETQIRSVSSYFPFDF